MRVIIHNLIPFQKAEIVHFINWKMFMEFRVEDKQWQKTEDKPRYILTQKLLYCFYIFLHVFIWLCPGKVRGIPKLHTAWQLSEEMLFFCQFTVPDQCVWENPTLKFCTLKYLHINLFVVFLGGGVCLYQMERWHEMQDLNWRHYSSQTASQNYPQNILEHS